MLALIEKPGRATLDVLAEILPVIIRTFPWPKSMRGAALGQVTGAAPLGAAAPLDPRTFGPETEEPTIVDFAVSGICRQYHGGHRFMAPAAISVRRFEDYARKLEAAKVVLDPERRQDIILRRRRATSPSRRAWSWSRTGLLEEVAGLVEWPVALMGSFDAAFLAIPDEVIRATIRANQKCFVVRDPERDAAPTNSS